MTLYFLVRSFATLTNHFSILAARESFHLLPGSRTIVSRRTHLLDIVVGECPTILELLAGEDQALLVRRDSFLVLYLALNIVDRV